MSCTQIHLRDSKPERAHAISCRADNPNTKLQHWLAMAFWRECLGLAEKTSVHLNICSLSSFREPGGPFEASAA